MIRIRSAGPTDAAAVSRVTIRSIRELCEADHGGDPQTVAGWVADPHHPLFVADREGEIAGACAFGL